jgi:hypothetical protein
LATYHATASPKQSKKFHVFHQRHFWKAAYFQEGCAPAEYSVIAAPHSHQKPGVMRKTVGQSIDWDLWQANSKKTTHDVRIIHDVLNLIQTAPWNFSIDMDKPEDVAVCGACTGVHLYRPIAFTRDQLFARLERKFNRAIRASAVGNNNLCAHCPLAQMCEKWPQQWRLV